MYLLGINEFLIMAASSVVLIVGGYQFYFWPQKSPYRKCQVGVVSELDHKIPFRPKWVWIYSVFYYPFMISPILWMESYPEFLWVCSSYLLLLLAHVIISHLRPIRTPLIWREYKDSSLSTRYLKFIQSIDKGGNCFPSMHVAVAAMTALHLDFMLSGMSIWGRVVVWGIVLGISASAVFTKQHFLVDLIWGAVLAIVVYFLFSTLVPFQIIGGLAD